MKTILGQTIENEEEYKKAYKTEADVIVTAVVLGFIGTRYHLKQPCVFGSENPPQVEEDSTENKEKESIKDKGKEKVNESVEDKGKNTESILKEREEYGRFEEVLKAMSNLLRTHNNKEIGSYLQGISSPPWEEGALITGRAGGHMMSPNLRREEMRGEASKRIRKLIAKNPKEYNVYAGKGAYTGMIDDPVNDDFMIRPTKRIIDSDYNRWHPGQGYANWGLIKPEGDEKVNLSKNTDIGMGPLPEKVIAPDRIGYIHGMCSAVAKCVSVGPWCTPYELATGKVTTRMASCFACTTYMYAAGYPPSLSHLGRGDSWVPPAPHLESGELIDLEMPLYYETSITKSLAARWHWEIYHYLRLGIKYLYEYKEPKQIIGSNYPSLYDNDSDPYGHVESNNIGGDCPPSDDKKSNPYEHQVYLEYVNTEHANAVLDLTAALEHLEQRRNKRRVNIGRIGGNLFLDALTVHDSDWKRIERTLKPAIERSEGVYFQAD